MTPNVLIVIMIDYLTPGQVCELAKISHRLKDLSTIDILWNKWLRYPQVGRLSAKGQFRQRVDLKLQVAGSWEWRFFKRVKYAVEFNSSFVNRHMRLIYSACQREPTLFGDLIVDEVPKHIIYDCRFFSLLANGLLTLSDIHQLQDHVLERIFMHDLAISAITSYGKTVFDLEVWMSSDAMVFLDLVASNEGSSEYELWSWLMIGDFHWVEIVSLYRSRAIEINNRPVLDYL